MIYEMWLDVINWLRYNFAAAFLYNETLQQTFRPLLSKLSKRQQI